MNLFVFLVARAVTESINHLIDVCTVSAPGQKECDNALRQIQVLVVSVRQFPINHYSSFSTSILCDVHDYSVLLTDRVEHLH